MIVKKRKIPLYLQQLEALCSRTPKSHPKFQIISDRYAREKAGYHGEKALDFHLSFLPEEKYHIFHNLRLYDGKNYFQMDSLILSTRFILILEVKNYKGTLVFDPEFNQMIRILDGVEEGYQDPIVQVERQTLQLKIWLNSHHFPNIPIESLVIISNPSTIIKALSKPHLVSQTVLHSASLPTKIRKFEKQRNEETLTPKEVKRLSRHLIKKHESFIVNILQHYQLTPNDILKGVQCPLCHYLSMNRISGSWYCPSCKTTSKEAHYTALRDYVLLLGNTITNQEIRTFLRISSSSIASKILVTMNLSYTGERKARRYDLTELLK